MCLHLRSVQRFCALLVSLTLIFTEGAYGTAHQEPLSSEKQMRTYHVGQTVVVKQVDGTVLRARVISLNESTVVLRPDKGPNIAIAYKNLTNVQQAGISKRAKIWIVVGIVFVALGIIGTRV